MNLHNTSNFKTTALSDNDLYNRAPSIFATGPMQPTLLGCRRPLCLSPSPGDNTSKRGLSAWGATSLPWLLLAVQSHRLATAGFPIEELEVKLKEPK